MGGAYLKVTMNFSTPRLDIEFIPDEDDRLNVRNKFVMGANNCYFILPDDWSIERTHPDAIALALLLIIQPFVGKRVELPIGISQHFSEKYQSIFRKEIGPIDLEISERKAPSKSVPSLAYSGGTDSTAALALMPENTVAVFLDRPQKAMKKNII